MIFQLMVCTLFVLFPMAFAFANEAPVAEVTTPAAASPQKKSHIARVPTKGRFHGQWIGAGVTYFQSKYKVTVSSIEANFNSTQNGLAVHWNRLLGGHFKSHVAFGTESVSSQAQINLAVCSSTTCSLKLRYLAGKGELWAGIFNYEEVGVNLGLTGGVLALYPVSKSSDAVDTASMGVTPGLTGGGFFEIRLRPGWWVWAQYSLWKFARGNSVEMEGAEGAVGLSKEL